MRTTTTTTTTPTTRSCPDDLLAIARRRPLSDLERQALSAHLPHCDLCRAGQLAAELLHDGRRLGAGHSPERDRALIERVATRASASVARGARRARPGARRFAVAAVAILGIGSGAFALVGRAPGRPAPVEPAGPGKDRPPLHRQLWKRPPIASAPTATPAPAPRKRIAFATARDAAPPAVPSATAASLFAEANGARRGGDLGRAASLYGTLRDRFPDSDQAHLAGISLGDLLLGLDEPARALGAFDSYLAEVRAGPLREEAMFGRARCLRKLGDVRAEEETWVILLRDFPASAYAPAARLRLAELRRPG
jgi:TolA-binding protein